MDEKLICLRCPNILPLNLYRQDEIMDSAGGEFHVLSLILSKRTGATLYHNVGGLIGYFEDFLLTTRIKRALSGSELLHIFLWQCLRDLKASFFLAFCGHCRQAAIITRAALELLVFGSYFQSAKHRNIPGLDKLWKSWAEGKKNRPRFSEAYKELQNWNVITSDIADEIKALYRELSDFAHTFAGDDLHRFVVEDRTDALVRPSSAINDDRLIREWFNQILEMFSLIVGIVQVFPLGLRDEGKELLVHLKNLVNVLKQGVIETVKFTICLRIEEINQL